MGGGHGQKFWLFGYIKTSCQNLALLKIFCIIETLILTHVSFFNAVYQVLILEPWREIIVSCIKQEFFASKENFSLESCHHLRQIFHIMINCFIEPTEFLQGRYNILETDMGGGMVIKKSFLRSPAQHFLALLVSILFRYCIFKDSFGVIPVAIIKID